MRKFPITTAYASSPEQVALLRAFCEHNKISQGDVLRDALARYLGTVRIVEREQGGPRIYRAGLEGAITTCEPPPSTLIAKHFEAIKPIAAAEVAMRRTSESGRTARRAEERRSARADRGAE